jgi:biotin carboxylase
VRVLVSDPEQRHAQAIIHALQKFGADVVTASDQRRRGLLGEPLALSPSDDCSTWIDQLEAHGVDVVIPVSIESWAFFSRHRATFEQAGIRGLLPRYDTWRRLHSKSESRQLASELDIPVPETIVVNETDVSAALVGSPLEFPVVVKSAEEGGARFVRYAKSLEEVEATICEFLQRKPEVADQGILVQEYIRGQGCAYFCLAKDGVVKNEFCHMRIRENPPTGGVSTCCRSYDHPRLKEYGRRLIAHTQYTGVCMVEFKYVSETDDFVLIEVNPKFWGSVLLPILSGVNFPVDYVRLALGEDVAPSPYGNETVVFFAADLKRALRNPKELRASLADLVDPSVHKDFQFFGWPNYIRFYAGGRG